MTRTRIAAYVLAGAATISLAFAAGVHSRSAYRYINVFQEVWQLTQANYVERIDEQTLLAGAYRGMLSSLDAASTFLGDAELELIGNPRGAADTGLGVLLSSGVPVVVSVRAGSAGNEAGLRPGDQIWRIDGRSARYIALPVLDRLLAGEAGKVLSLKVLDSRTYKLKDVDVTLQASGGPGFVMTVDSGGGSVSPVVHLRLDDPHRLDTSRLDDLLRRRAREMPTAPLLVDVRGFVGLDVALMERLSGVLLPRGDMLRLVARNDSGEVIAGDEEGPAPPFAGRTMVLQDGGTAGVGEAIAAVLRESGGAKSCGRESYGLAGLPELIELENGGSIYLTTLEMRTAGGLAWVEEGLKPDRLLSPKPAPGQQDEESDAPRPDLLLESALTWIREGAQVEEEADETLRPAA